MNLLRFQSVFALCVLFLLFGYGEVTSAPLSNITEDDQTLCASPCYESLKEQIQAKAQDHIERDNEIRELRNLEKIPQIGCKGLSSGNHTITIPNLDPFPVLCNGDIADGGWIVIQKRFDGSENFYRNWTEYRKGFGKLDGEFFIGLENLHRITNSQRYELYIEMKNFDGEVKFARYDNFRIGNENEKYQLKSIGDYSGTADDYLKWDVDAKFSTYDQDNDGSEIANYAEYFHSCWWYNRFFAALVNLNGRYYKSYSYNGDAMRWSDYFLKSVQMLIRPKSE